MGRSVLQERIGTQGEVHWRPEGEWGYAPAQRLNLGLAHCESVSTSRMLCSTQAFCLVFSRMHVLELDQHEHTLTQAKQLAKATGFRNLWVAVSPTLTL